MTRSFFILPLKLLFAPSTYGACVAVVEAVKLATMYTHQGIATAFTLGGGHGPLNHMHSLLSRTLQRRGL